MIHLRFLLVLAFAMPGALIISCSDTKETKKAGPDTFSVVRPLRIDTLFTREYIAQIQSLQNVEIRTRVKGFIEKIHVDEGKPVREGQILFTLTGREFHENLLKARANYKSAVAELKMAEVEWKNTSTLAEKDIVSTTELEMAIARKEAIEAKIEDAKAAIAIAELNLSYTQIRAPFTGVINRIPYKTGSLVSEGDLLTTISNNQEMFAYFNVSEKEFLDMMKKDSAGLPGEVSLQLANNELFRQKGKIETAENEIDRGTGNIAFRARFQNPRQVLRHGATGKILLKDSLKQVILIPQKATFEIQDKIYVYVVDSSNQVRMRNITPGIRLSTFFVVNAGLNENDRVIYEGIQQVEEGKEVKTRLLTMNDIKQH